MPAKPMSKNDKLLPQRESLLMRVAELWRGDWSANSFNGDDGHEWIDTALHGTADDLAQLDYDLGKAEGCYE